MSLDYKGFTAVQSAVNNHVIIFLGDKFAAEIQCTKKCSDEELRALIDSHLQLESKAKTRSPNNIFYGEMVRKARCEKRIRIIEMAGRIKCTLIHYCDIECGYVTATEEEKVKIKRELGMRM